MRLSPLYLGAILSFACANAHAANAFWSFDTWKSGDGVFTTTVTAHDFKVDPVLQASGTELLNSGGARSFTAFDGTTWQGSGRGATPGHSLAWSSGSRDNSFRLTLDATGLSGVKIRMDIRAYGLSAQMPFTALEYDNGSDFQSLHIALPSLDKDADFREWSITIDGAHEFANATELTLRWRIPDIPEGCSLRIDNLQISAVEGESVSMKQPEWIDLPTSANLLAAGAALPWKTAGERAVQTSFEWIDGDTPQAAILRMETTGLRQLKNWALRVETPLAQAVSKGDILYLRFRVRCLETRDETGQGHLNATVQLTNAPYTKEISGPYATSREWNTYAVWARASRDYPAGALDLNFRLGGFAAQTIEVSDLGLYLLPPTQDTSALPVTPPPTYEGRSANAFWRTAAAERIERLRKQDMTIKVLDAEGRPLAGVPVAIRQLRHDYQFGTAVSLWEITRPRQDTDAEQYRRILQSSFDAAGPENDLKWANWLRDETNTMEGLEWLCAREFYVRGHVLLWPSWDRTPAFLSEWQDNPPALRDAILTHAEDVLMATAPFIGAWDVVNEPMFNHEILDVLGGDDFMAEMFRCAREIAPEAKLYLNEAVTLSDNQLMRKFIGMVQSMNSREAPIDGLGIQCHYSAWALTPPAEIIATLDTLQALGKTIAVTEFDVDTLDENLQADYLRDFYTAVFSHPATTGIQMWGFWEDRHWKPAAALWRRDWSPKPAAITYLDLVRREWWTDEDGKTDQDGQWALRAFKGRLRVSVYADGRNLVREVDLGDEPGELIFDLKSR